jgi:hypothetical protein
VSRLAPRRAARTTWTTKFPSDSAPPKTPVPLGGRRFWRSKLGRASVIWARRKRGTLGRAAQGRSPAGLRPTAYSSPAPLPRMPALARHSTLPPLSNPGCRIRAPRSRVVPDVSDTSPVAGKVAHGDGVMVDDQNGSHRIRIVG